MEIKIFYKLLNGNETHEICLLPEEYFGPLTEDENGYSINSIAKFIFPYEYLDYELKDLISVDLSIKDQESYFKREFFLWNEGKNSTDHILSFDAKKSDYFEWIITTTVVTNNEGFDIEETLRMYKNQENRWIVTAHSYRTLMPLDEKDLTTEMDVHKTVFKHITGFYKVNP